MNGRVLMRLQTSEIVFVGFMVLVACATGLVLVTALLGLPLAYLYAALGLLCTALVVGATVLYPQFHRQSQKSFELEDTTRRLEQKSLAFQQAALTDVLTGLQNRRYFDNALNEYLDEFRRIDRPVGLLIIDLDHFKSINDTHGHAMGDAVLKEVGDCLSNLTRAHDIVARLGGEEFAIVATNLDMEGLKLLARRVGRAIAGLQIDADNISLKVTASIGVALWDGTEDGSTLVKRADDRLYAAKNTGRNKVAA